MQSQPVIVRNSGPGLLIRALYFILFGLWFSGIWAAVAWVLCVTIIGRPSACGCSTGCRRSPPYSRAAATW